MEVPQEFWIYENWTHKYAKIHSATCPYCNNGRGMHGKSSNINGQWLGPVESLAEAKSRAEKTGRDKITNCEHCI